MKTINSILEFIQNRDTVTGTEIGNHFGISRQAVNKHLKNLILTGKVIKTGHTKGSLYFPATHKSGKSPVSKYENAFSIKKIEEDSIFREIDSILNIKKNVRSNIYDIIKYMFTEMLNNAIDHSQSEKCLIRVTLDNYIVKILIRDYGIGLFNSISTKYKLRDDYEVIGELIKGKTTTMKERHSGEGIFFTSKAADIASYRSSKISLTFENIKQDLVVSERKKLNGTEVLLSISRNSHKKLTQIFNQYAPEDYEYRFEKTHVFVKLFQKEFISRSEARRLLSGLTKFREICLDFNGVTSLGQGFADEIFRVFQKHHPNIKITTKNVSPTIEPMIQHVVDK